MSKQKKSQWTSEGKLKGLKENEIENELAAAKKEKEDPAPDEMFELTPETDKPEDVILIEANKVELLGGEEPISLEGKAQIKLEGRTSILLSGKGPEALANTNEPIQQLEGNVTELLQGRKRISIEGGTIKIETKEEEADAETEPAGKKGSTE